MLNAQEDVITDVRMSIEIMTYVLQMSKLQSPRSGRQSVGWLLNLKLKTVCGYRLSPAHAGWGISMTASWGSRPRLYALACSAG
jgi:hypothetical protein